MKVVVAYGGVSPEREVSLRSGAAVAEALAEAGIEAVLEDVKCPKEFLIKWDRMNADGVFIALHGGWGEDGRFQTLLDAYGIPYTGSGPEACMLAMDKSIAKLVFKENGVPVPDGFSLVEGEDCNGAGIKMLEKYGRLIVKPNGGGSTVGVTQAATKDELISGLETAWKIETKALVEEYIDGSEMTVPVWENKKGEVIALPAIDIRPKTGFYDYKNKYTSGCTEYICPAQISSELEAKLAKAAVACHKGLGCRAYSRTDFRVTGSEDIYALEVNTAPGMTGTSLVPKSARAYGVSFPEFLADVINVSFAIKRN